MEKLYDTAMTVALTVAALGLFVCLIRAVRGRGRRTA